MKQLFKMFFSDDGFLFTYAFAFSLVLTLAPSLLIVVLLFSLTYVDFSLIEEVMLRFIPNLTNEQIQYIVAYFTNRQYSWFSFSSTMSASFYLASKSIYALLLISSKQEKVELPHWYLRCYSIMFYIRFVVVLVIFIHICYPYLLKSSLFRFFSLWFFIYWFYHSLSMRKRSLLFGLNGAFIFCILFHVLERCFLFIIQYFTSYQVIYGPLASFVTLILAIYLISCIIYIGFCWNVVWQKEDIEQLPFKKMKSYDVLQRWIIYLHRKIRKRN